MKMSFESRWGEKGGRISGKREEELFLSFFLEKLAFVWCMKILEFCSRGNQKKNHQRSIDSRIRKDKILSLDNYPRTNSDWKSVTTRRFTKFAFRGKSREIWKSAQPFWKRFGLCIWSRPRRFPVRAGHPGFVAWCVRQKYSLLSQGFCWSRRDHFSSGGGAGAGWKNQVFFRLVRRRAAFAASRLFIFISFLPEPVANVRNSDAEALVAVLI